MTPIAEPTLDFEAGLRAFGFDSFRPGQLEALEALVLHRPLARGADRRRESLIYRPRDDAPGTTLVISP